MNLQITTYQFGDRPEVTRPDQGFYLALGEDGIRNMVNKHYELLRKSSINHLFSADDKSFESAKRNSADFLIQYFGGPDYYNQHRGKPMLVNRHSPFKITHEARLVWLSCYKQVLLELEIPQDLIVSFWNYINVFSMWMVNSKSN